MEKTSSLPKAESLPLVMTLGHSTRHLAEFIHLLQANGVSRVVECFVRILGWTLADGSVRQRCSQSTLTEH
jgi:hypothetical protein